MAATHLLMRFTRQQLSLPSQSGAVCRSAQYAKIHVVVFVVPDPRLLHVEGKALHH
jgi:hypothetical protein